MKRTSPRRPRTRRPAPARRQQEAPSFSLLDQRPTQAPPPTEDALAALLAQVVALSAGLLPYYQLLYRTPLTTSQRKSLAALLPSDPSGLVRATAYALGGTDQHQDPLFADLPASARSLGLSQEVASRLRLLCNHFGLLHRLCQDAFLEAQADAVQQARAAIAAVLNEQPQPPRDLRRTLRQLAMAAPVSLDPPRRKKALKPARRASRTITAAPRAPRTRG